MSSAKKQTSVDNQVVVIVLAAGKGMRMKSATPKVLHKICGQSILYRVLKSARGVVVSQSAENGEVVLVLGHEFEKLKTASLAFADDLNLHLNIARQTEIQGTGSALIAAFEKLDTKRIGTVVVISGDTPLITSRTLNALVDAHMSSQNSATLLTASVADPTGYGRVKRGASGEVLQVVEEKDVDEFERGVEEINSSIYAFECAFLEEYLCKITTANAQREKYLTQIVELGVECGSQIGASRIEELGGEVHEIEGVNNRVQLAKLAEIRRLQIVQEHQLNGVTVTDPGSTRIEEDVEIGEDVEILPGCVILPGNKIASGAQIGPHAYLRPGNVIGKCAKVGAFVEVKNSRIGSGSKVPHLSYVGDAVIGEDTNIGAGSIFANYDGVSKNRTIVGSGVKIGSKTVLVAPVEVSDNAYTGAGTVLRENVPENALAYSENSVTIVDEWVKNNRTSN
ncbi:MAG: NTP transferase domain-containing protein [Candidatus Ancillula trichonymphae]|jgi:bifunctional UDP-N-acetylglucosamine pyrophosphorylase/glucosamine-1-phosphate N-acetyltransferase|nr:NTP transferase domain-containing protein [Candidatus Ancillula trichonymphae]